MSNIGTIMIIIIKVKKWNKYIGKFKLSQFCVWRGENGMREFVTCHL